jgi:hypothetical protein
MSSSKLLSAIAVAAAMINAPQAAVMGTWTGYCDSATSFYHPASAYYLPIQNAPCSTPLMVEWRVEPTVDPDLMQVLWRAKLPDEDDWRESAWSNPGGHISHAPPLVYSRISRAQYEAAGDAFVWTDFMDANATMLGISVAHGTWSMTGYGRRPLELLDELVPSLFDEVPYELASGRFYDVVKMNGYLTTIPEPGTLGLLLLGVGWLWRRRTVA